MSHKRQNTHTLVGFGSQTRHTETPSVFLKLIAIIFYAGSYYSANSAWLETVETHDLHTQAGGHTHTHVMTASQSLCCTPVCDALC